MEESYLEVDPSSRGKKRLPPDRLGAIRGEQSTSHMWLSWAGFYIFVMIKTILPLVIPKIPFLISVYPKKFWEDWMRVAGFVMNFLFSLQKN